MNVNVLSTRVDRNHGEHLRRMQRSHDLMLAASHRLIEDVAQGHPWEAGRSEKLLSWLVKRHFRENRRQ